jgi:hypothetical protein
MRRCEQCGLSVGDAATFCPVCGAGADSLVSTASAAPASDAVQSGVSAAAPPVGHDDGTSRSHEDAVPGHPHEASLLMSEAGHLEKTDPGRAAALYRDAILCSLEATEDPLEQADVRRDLLRTFDRLSLVLKREGLPEEALEQIDSAASLGLLDCRDQGIKGHRDAMKKRRVSLRRALDR